MVDRVLRTLLAGGLIAGLVLTHAGALVAQDGAFDAWLRDLRREAAGRGIAAATLEAALTGLAPIERVIELDRKQPESTLTFEEYLARVVPDSRIAEGREQLRRHGTVLREIGARYGVQPRFIVALWGIESDYGKRTGSFPVIGALTTLAYDGRRSSYFRKELLDALHILDEGHIPVGQMEGSWAGAMGQVQFMPSSFRRYAVDYDGDGRRDLWGNLGDVFASAANYLSRLGWRGDQTWGREVRLSEAFDRSLIDPDRRKRLSEWQRLGVRSADGSDLPARDLRAALVQPGGPGTSAFAVYDNYQALLRWNRSTYFATAVGYLADRLAGP